ncbi:MAG: alpha-glucuronidase family glycosyl hydrolase [Verrucomicrobiota bacterium]
MKKFTFFISLLLFVGIAFKSNAAAPTVTVAIGEDAPALEAYAALEMARQFKELFQASVEVAKFAPPNTEHLVLVGSPATNPAIAKLVGDKWPKKLSEQGHLLKSIEIDGKTVLIVGGGSPVATLWAVYELGHSFGIRYMLHDDFLPVDTPEFTLAGFDTVLEPNLRIRAWQVAFAGPASQESWGLAEQKILLKQLAKLKFNRVSLAQKASQQENANGKEFSVSGDTAGRSVFAGAKIFENPDLAGKNTVQERIDARIKMLAEVSNLARKLGIRPSAIAKKQVDSKIVLLPLGQGGGGLLPQFSTSKLPAKLAEIRSGKKDGFAVTCSIPGDLNMDIYYLSRASFDSKITPAESLVDLVKPICGEGVVERLSNGFAAIEEVSALIEKNDYDFAVPDPKMFMKNYTSSEPAPEWWAKATELYGTAVNEMYRGNTRARDGARPFILYQAKHFTFALHYMMAVDAARKAGIARAAKDTDAQVENLETAVEQMHNALGIYADVARDNSDRGVIAILNKYAYRPLLKELDELPLP